MHSEIVFWYTVELYTAQSSTPQTSTVNAANTKVPSVCESGFVFEVKLV